MLHIGPVRVPAARRNRRFLVLLGAITLGALVLRIVYVLWQRDTIVWSDGLHYHDGANYLADGRGFINPISVRFSGVVAQDAVHPPLWELVLSVPSRLGLRTYLEHQLTACLVGTATVFMTGLAGREAFGRRVGLIAAAIAAVYANMWLFERELLSEPAAQCAIATLIWLAYRFRHRPSLGRAIALGGGLGLLMLVRSEMLMMSVLLVAPLVLRRTEVGTWRRVGWLAAAGTTCVLLLAPWAIYNSSRFERPVPLSTGFGSTLWSGNCPPAYSGPLYGYATECTFVTPNISEDPSVADGQFRTLAIDYMRDHISEVPLVSLARLGRTFGVFRPGQQLGFETFRGTSLWVFQLGTAMYWVLLPLAVYGVVIARRRKVMVYPLLVVPLAVVLATAFTIGAIRYRAPAEVTLVLLAAVGIDQLARLRRRRQEVREPEVEARPVAVAAGALHWDEP